jgi:hypothetical protein
VPDENRIVQALEVEQVHHVGEMGL